MLVYYLLLICALIFLFLQNMKRNLICSIRKEIYPKFKETLYTQKLKRRQFSLALILLPQNVVFTY